jgi:predicted acetyltransferase
VVDQSKPTESRGLKLALLAAAKRIKHLIVIADEKNAAEAKAIHGVHGGHSRTRKREAPAGCRRSPMPAPPRLRR